MPIFSYQLVARSMYIYSTNKLGTQNTINNVMMENPVNKKSVVFNLLRSFCKQPLNDPFVFYSRKQIRCNDPFTQSVSVSISARVYSQ